MSQLKVLAGDFAKRNDSFFLHIATMGTFTLHPEGKKFGQGEKISITQVESVEIVSESKNKQRITFKCIFSDGRQLMAETDQKTYTSIQAALMDAPKQLEAEQKYQAKLEEKASQKASKQPGTAVTAPEAIRLIALMMAWFFSMISLSSSMGAVFFFAFAALTVTKRVTIPLRKKINIPAFALPVSYVVFFAIGWPLLVNSATIQENLNASNTAVEAPADAPPQVEQTQAVNTPKPEPTATPDKDLNAAGAPPTVSLFGGYDEVKKAIKKELGSEPEYVRWFEAMLNRDCDGGPCWRVKTVINHNGQQVSAYAYMRYGKVLSLKFE